MNQRPITSTIYLDGKQAEQELKGLAARVDEYAGKMNKARKANDKAGFDKLNREYKAAKREMKSYKKSVVDVSKVLNNLNGTSLKTLISTQRKLSVEISKSNRGTKEEIALYNKKVSQLKLVKGQITKLRLEMNTASVQQKSFFRRMNDGFNKYSMFVMSTVASLMAVILAFKKAVSAANDFESAVANLSALTKLSGDNLEWLKKQAIDLSGSMTESGIRISYSAQEIVDAYTIMGSKRPELLKDKEALAEVTKQAIILSAAAKADLEPSVEALAVSLNQFNASAEEAPKFIAAIAAGSQAGAGNVNYLSEAIEKSGTSANSAKLSIEQNIALVETIAPKFKRARVAGTKLNNIIVRLQTTSDQFNPKIVGMTKALENLEKADLSVIEQKKLFGLENLAAAQTLVQNRKEYENYLKVVTDTNVAEEQALTNTSTRAAKLDAARAKLAKYTIELGEKIAPAMTFSTSMFGKIIKLTLALIEFTSKYSKELTITLVAIAAYTVAIKIQTYWDNIHYASLVAKNAVTKAYTTIVGILTGKVKIATIAQKLWNLAQKANPIGLLIGLLIAAGTALALYSRRLSDSEIAQKALNDAMIEAKKSMVAERVNLEKLLAVAKNEKLSKEKRLQAIKDINAISPEYLKGITLETINTEDAKKAIDKYIVSLEKKAKVQAATEQLVEIEKKLIDLRTKGTGAETAFWQTAKNGLTSYGNAAIFYYKEADDFAKNYSDTEQTLLAQKTALLGIVKETNEEEAKSTGKKDDDDVTEKITTLKVLREELAKLIQDRDLINVKDQVTLDNNQKSIDKLKVLISRYEVLKTKIDKTTKSKKKFNAANIEETSSYFLDYETMKYNTLSGYRKQDLKELEDSYKSQTRLLQMKHNKELMLLGNDYRAKENLQKEFEQNELQRKIEHLQNLKSLLSQQLEDISFGNSFLSDEEQDIIKAKLEEIDLAISELGVLQEDEEEPQSLLGKILFGEGDEGTLSDKIRVIGQMAMDAFSSIDKVITNAENRQFQQFSRNNEKKKQLLKKRLDSGIISEETYTQRIQELDDQVEQKKKALAHEQAKRQKAMAIMNAVINTAVAITGALASTPGPAGIILSIIIGALGALQIAAIASEPVPQYREGNFVNVIGQDDNKMYKAAMGNGKTRIESKPTFEPGLGLIAEDEPELVFSGADTNKILNSPELIQAINYTISTPQFSTGNFTKEIIRENYTSESFTDPALIDLLNKVGERLDQPAIAVLNPDENYLRVHNKAQKEYSEFKEKVN